MSEALMTPVKARRIDALPANSMKMARGDDTDIDVLRRFFLDMEEAYEDGLKDGEVAALVDSRFDEVGMRWRRVVDGFMILRNTCTDPNLSYLDWKPELLALTAAHDTLLDAAKFALSVLVANYPVERSEFLAIERLQAAIAGAAVEKVAHGG